MDDLNQKLNSIYPRKVVRKDLTKRIKEGANVPVYVLEYLLGMYCATDDEVTIEEGVTRVKNILAQNYVRPDEAEQVKSKIRELGRFTIIDRVTVTSSTVKPNACAICSTVNPAANIGGTASNFPLRSPDI